MKLEDAQNELQMAESELQSCQVRIEDAQKLHERLLSLSVGYKPAYLLGKVNDKKAFERE